MYSIIVKVRIVVVLQKSRSYLVLTSSMVVMYAEQTHSISAGRKQNDRTEDMSFYIQPARSTINRWKFGRKRTSFE